MTKEEKVTAEVSVKGAVATVLPESLGMFT